MRAIKMGWIYAKTRLKEAILSQAWKYRKKKIENLQFLYTTGTDKCSHYHRCSYTQ